MFTGKLFGLSPARPESRPVAGTRRAARFRLEQLEDRATPALFTWAAVAVNQAWSDPAAWRVDGGGNPQGLQPGVNDTVVFDGTSTQPSLDASVRTIKEMQITAAYTGTLTLAAMRDALTAELVTTNGFTIASGTVRPSPDIAGSLVSRGDNGYTSLITGGTFERVRIDVMGDAAVATSAKMDGSFTMTSSSIYVNPGAKLAWTSGSVTQGDIRDIGITNSGVFEISASGTFPNSVSNEGTVIVSGGPTINSFINSLNLRVDAGGTLKCNVARQLAGTTELRGGTVKMLTASPYNLVDGTMIGSGSIDGNLTMGWDPNGPGGPQPPTCVSLNPGTAGTPGTIAITQSFQNFSSDGWVEILFKSLTNYSKVTIGGNAALKGTLIVNFTPDEGTPMKGSIVPMTYGSVTADFDYKTSFNYYITSVNVGPTSYTVNYSNLP